MLGVVGIHTGSYLLLNKTANIHLIFILEVLTRFSIPAFFFISAFGSFVKKGILENFSYGSFLKSRVKSILIPYLVWSFIYMCNYVFMTGDSSIFHWPLLGEFLFFGVSSYQLYFLVILLWFYILMPLWIKLAKIMLKNEVVFLSGLFIFQILFHYVLGHIKFDPGDNYYLNILWKYKLNYVVFYYIFVFFLGTYFALKFNKIKDFLSKNSFLIDGMFIVTILGITGYYYYLLKAQGYDSISVVNMCQQLSFPGFLFSTATIVFLYKTFVLTDLNKLVEKCLDVFAKHSYVIYLVHPLFMYYLSFWLIDRNISMTIPVTILFFVVVTFLSILISIMLTRASRRVTEIGLLFMGKGSVKKDKNI